MRRKIRDWFDSLEGDELIMVGQIIPSLLAERYLLSQIGKDETKKVMEYVRRHLLIMAVSGVIVGFSIAKWWYINGS